MLREQYNELKNYGKILADKNHKTTDGHYIRFTVYDYEGHKFLAILFDGYVASITEKTDADHLLEQFSKRQVRTGGK